MSFSPIGATNLGSMCDTRERDDLSLASEGTLISKRPPRSAETVQRREERETKD
jgi:hypothetical protein